ncbi:MAG: hypothetical protein K0Q77_872 [Anaerosporomusa subterranea]|jgi:hypothetical protein|nr:hypothetical protein [Anaerosporomusa subterranea]
MLRGASPTLKPDVVSTTVGKQNERLAVRWQAFLMLTAETALYRRTEERSCVSTEGAE